LLTLGSILLLSRRNAVGIIADKTPMATSAKSCVRSRCPR
jgi:hypothetical protein